MNPKLHISLIKIILISILIKIILITDPNLDQVKHLGFHITNQKIPRIVPGHLGMD